MVLGGALSRTKAKKLIDGKSLKKEFRRKWHKNSCINSKRTVEEAPDAYKDVDEVIELTKSAGLARPVVRMKPNIVIKG